VKTNATEELIREQVTANLSGVAHHEAFAGHRERLTEHLLARVGTGEARLCLLGTGNGNDVDLARLLERYREVHLVDVDATALERAAKRVTGDAAARLVRHAPVDVSGVLDRLDRWARLELTPEELIGHADFTARMLQSLLPAPFDVVASTCLLTQIQRAPVAILGDKHRLFQAVRHTLSVTHLKVLHALVAPGGKALFVSDISADSITKLPDAVPGESLVPLVADLVRQGKVIQVAQPELLRAMARDDPELSAGATLSPPFDAWLWENGPGNRFLVYAMELERRR